MIDNRVLEPPVPIFSVDPENSEAKITMWIYYPSLGRCYKTNELEGEIINRDLQTCFCLQVRQEP